ncbi:MAG TPA: hypothetical protein VES59_00160 [Bacteroidota bacterium]|nr:hypothetical protein [Bacteroidota bacterium]
MIMKTIDRSKSVIIPALVPLLLLLFLGTPVFGQGRSGEEVQTSNVKWSIKDDVILLNYDLMGSPDDEFDLSIALKKEGDASFAVVPKAAEGDIGRGYFAGKGREIRWFYRTDNPGGFSGEGYYFEIHVQLVKKESKLLYYALGAAALAGGILALIVSQKPVPPTPPYELPGPPARP